MGKRGKLTRALIASGITLAAIAGAAQAKTHQHRTPTAVVFSRMGFGAIVRAGRVHANHCSPCRTVENGSRLTFTMMNATTGRTLERFTQLAGQACQIQITTADRVNHSSVTFSPGPKSQGTPCHIKRFTGPLTTPDGQHEHYVVTARFPGSAKYLPSTSAPWTLLG